MTFDRVSCSGYRMSRRAFSGAAAGLFLGMNVRSLLARTQGNVSEAARLSGLSRVALQKILARTGERAADFR